MKIRQHFLLFAFFAIGLSLPAVAPLFAEDRIAIEGYDPVAYFTEAKPVKGNPRYRFVFDGTIYHFSNAKHLEMFRSEPDRYAPVFRGLCTFALSRGAVATANPQAWVIHNGQLHLFAAPSGHYPPESDKTVAKAAAHYEEMGRPRPADSGQ